MLSHSSGVRVNECGSELILHLTKDCGTESNCVYMYTVQCRVSVDNKCEFQHSSFHDACILNVRRVSKTRNDEQTTVSDILSRLTFFHRIKLKKEDTFKARGSIVAPTQWLDRKSSSLPTDSCSTNLLRQLCHLILVQPSQ